MTPSMKALDRILSSYRTLFRYAGFEVYVVPSYAITDNYRQFYATVIVIDRNVSRYQTEPRYSIHHLYRMKNEELLCGMIMKAVREELAEAISHDFVQNVKEQKVLENLNKGESE